MSIEPCRTHRVGAERLGLGRKRACAELLQIRDRDEIGGHVGNRQLGRRTAATERSHTLDRDDARPLLSTRDDTGLVAHVRASRRARAPSSRHLGSRGS